MLTQKKMQYDKAGPKVAEALNKRFFEAYYCSDRESGLQKVLELIPQNHVVSWGGTSTVDELGIKDALRQRGQAVIDRDTAKDAQERKEMLKKALTCDTFLMSSNAISSDGELVNIDGTGNRLAALCFGPKQVLVLCSAGKIQPTTETAVSRARNTAAPANALRFGGKTPCAADGLCHNCLSPDCICNQILLTRACRPAGRVHVFLIGEELGL